MALGGLAEHALWTGRKLVYQQIQYSGKFGVLADKMYMQMWNTGTPWMEQIWSTSIYCALACIVAGMYHAVAYIVILWTGMAGNMASDIGFQGCGGELEGWYAHNM